MSRYLNPAQQAVFDQIDERTFWAMASAYRNERQRGRGEAAAFEEALAVLGERFAIVSLGTITNVTKTVLARAASGPPDWFWE